MPKNFWYIYRYENNTVYVIGFSLGLGFSMNIDDYIVVVDKIEYWI